MTTAKPDHKAKRAKPFNDNEPVLSFVSLEELTRPKTGLYVVCDRWWIMHPTKGAVFYRTHFPQHHTQREISEFQAELVYPWAEVHFIGVAYIPIRHQVK